MGERITYAVFWFSDVFQEWFQWNDWVDDFEDAEFGMKTSLSRSYCLKAKIVKRVETYEIVEEKEKTK